METIGSNSIVNEKLFCGGVAISFIRELKKYDQTIKPLKLSGVRSYIIENGRLELFEKNYIVDKDVVIVSFCLKRKEEEVRSWINAL